MLKKSHSFYRAAYLVFILILFLLDVEFLAFFNIMKSGDVEVKPVGKLTLEITEMMKERHKK